MNTILDNIDQENKTCFYSILSFIVGIATALVFVIAIFTIPETNYITEEIPPIVETLFQLSAISSIIGLIITVVSFRRQEYSNPFKWIGAILNILMISIIILLFLLGLFW